MRRLTLHASALNDEEYNLYTTSLADLVFCDSTQHDKNTTRGDAFYEQLSVSVREVRAWLRGRYPDIPLERIDAILKLFSPALAQGDLFSGGQFFAVLRLVVHAQNGKEVDRGLAFVQAHPTSSTRSLSTTQPTSGVTSPQPSRRLDGYAASSASETALRPSTNPFSYDSLPQPPLHPSQRQDPSKSAHSPNNPFISRSKSISEDGSGRLPPLPPRKTSVQKPPPPRHASISSSTSAPTHPHTSASASTNVSRPPPPVPPHSSSSHQHPPLPPPPPPKLKSKPPNHVTSTLIKQSLQASKAAQTMKKAEEQLEKERVLQVLRSSAVVSGSNMARSFGSGSRSPSKRTPVSQQSLVAQSDSSTSWSGGEERERPPLPRRRQRQQQQPSPPMSTSSLEQVALAVAPSGTRSHPHTPFTSSPFESPSNSPRGRLMLDLPSVAGLPPPTHPDRKPHGYSHQIPSTAPDEQSLSPSISPFRRNLDSFEAIYGTDSTASSFSTPTPTTPTTTSDLTPSSSASPQQRVYRSRSLHHHSPQSHAPPPPPARRRRRPESVQVLSNGEVLFGGSSSPTKSPSRDSSNVLLKNSIAQSIQTPHRRSSYSASFSGSAPPSSLFSAGGGGNGNGGGADVIQRKFAELQMKAESALPMLEAARYKAEAGLSRRGFIQGSSHGKDEVSRGRIGVKEDREGLMSGYSGDQYGREEDGVRGGGGGLSVDSGDEECAQGQGERKVVEQDALKWPAGEGWSRML